MPTKRPANHDHPIRRFLVACALVVIPIAVALFGLVVRGLPARGAETIGTAKLALADGTSIGSATFTNEAGSTQTRVVVALAVPPSATATRAFHGFHVHANDNPVNGVDCAADPRSPSSTWFVSADGHFRRDAAELHGNHAGDLPSIYLNRDGKASLELVVDRFTAGELFNRAVILHAGPDNFGNIPLGDAANQYRANGADATTATANTGNAGDRVACGVIDVRR